MSTTPRRAAAAVVCLLLAGGCTDQQDGATSSGPGSGTASASRTTGKRPASGGPSSTTARPTVTKPAEDTFSVCDSRKAAKDAGGHSYCATAAHEIPAGSASLACIADLTSVPATSARLKVTYSVYMQQRNIAYFRDIDPSRYTIKDFQARYDFVPTDAKWWGLKTLPPGSYYCEWYDDKGAKLGEKDLIHGKLPSSTIGTPGDAV